MIKLNRLQKILLLICCSFCFTGCLNSFFDFNVKTIADVAVTSVTIDSTLELTAGETKKLTATVLPENATDKTVTWTSSDTEVAEVENGTVTAKAAGTAKITAKAGDKTAECTVTVNPVTPAVIAVTSVTIDSTLELTAGETKTLTAAVLPENATDKTVTWTSSDTEVAAVENGTVTAKAAGTAKITAKAGDKTAECTVTVNPVTPAVIAVTTVTIDSTLELTAGETKTLTAAVLPENATDKTVTWTSSDTEVAEVENGTVTAKAAGTAKITAKAGDKTAECTVTVNPVTGTVKITISSTENDIAITLPESGTVLTAETGYDSYQWYVDNNKVDGAAAETFDYSSQCTVKGTYTICVEAAKNGTVYSTAIHVEIE